MFPLVGQPQVFSGDQFLAKQPRWAWSNQAAYPQALEMLVGTQAIFRLSRQAGQVLRTELGVRDVGQDDQATGDVRFRVLTVDGRGQAREVWSREVSAAARPSSPTVGAGDQSLVEIELGDAVAVVLAVERAGGTFSGPTGIWIEPIII